VRRSIAQHRLEDARRIAAAALDADDAAGLGG
jgi:hypothetical protein